MLVSVSQLSAAILLDIDKKRRATPARLRLASDGQAKSPAESHDDEYDRPSFDNEAETSDSW